MKKIKYILLFILISFSLCSCSYDIENLTQTYGPELKESPISGVWEIEEILVSESRFSYSATDKFIFDKDLYASSTDIYSNPNYEVQKLEWSSIQGNNEMWRRVDLFDEDERINLIRIYQNGKLLAEVIPLDQDQAVLGSHNQILNISQEKEEVTEEVKAELIQEQTRTTSGTSSLKPFAVALGYRQAIEDQGDRLTNYDYNTLIIYYDTEEYQVYRVNGLLINEQSNIDHYDVVREDLGDKRRDNIYLNGEFRPIIDADGERQSDYFTIEYLSNNYITLEYIKEEANTLSTYSTRAKGGFTQLKSDDIIEFTSDRIYEYSRKIDNLLPLSEAVYNIGIDRENGLSILKGRLVTEVEDKLINRDFFISGDFRMNEEREKTFNLEKRLIIDNPDMLDFYLTPDESKVIVVNKDNLIVYNLNKVKESDEFVIEKKENTDIISYSKFNEQDLNLLRESVNI